MQVAVFLYRSGAPTSKTDIDWIINNTNIRKIISLDQIAGNRVRTILNSHPRGKEITHIMLPIVLSNEASIKNAYLKLRANNLALYMSRPGTSTLIHCLRGIDRTGFAIALYRVNKEGWNPDKAIAEAKRYGYGVSVTKPILDAMNSYIGLKNKEVDVSAVSDDIVTLLREDKNYQQQKSLSADSIPPAFNPQQSWSVTETSQDEGYPPVNIRSRIDTLNKLMKKAKEKSAVIIGNTDKNDTKSFYKELKRFLTGIGYSVLICSHHDVPPVADLWVAHNKGTEILRIAPSSVKLVALNPGLDLTNSTKKFLKAMSEDVNDALMGGGPIGSPTADSLPAGQGMPSVGDRDNYQGSIPGTNFGGTGGTPGTGCPGALVDLDPYGMVQL